MLGAEILLDLVSAMHRIVRPLEDAIENEEAFTNFLAHYGWLVDPSTINIAEVSNSFAILDDLATVGQSLGAIVTAPESDVQLDAYVDLLSSLQKVISRIRDLSSSPVPVGLSSQLWTTFANELLDGLIADYFRIHNPVLFALLVLTGVIEEEQVDVDGVPRRQNYIRWILKWGRITTMVSNPLAFIKESSAWGSVEQPFDYDLLFERLARFFSLIGLQTEFEEPAPELRDIYYAANNPHASKVKELHIVLVRAESGNGDLFKGLLYLLPIPAEDPSDAPGGVVIGPSIELIGDVPAFAISPYSVAFSGAFAHDRSVRIEVRPTGEKVVSESPGETRIDTFIELSDADYPVLLLGSWFSHHLRARGWTTRFHVIGSFQDPEFQFELAFRELGLILDSSDFDVFLKDAFRTDAPSLQFNGSIVWSSKTGLHFGGQAGLELIVPINRTISVVEVNSLALGLRAGDDNLEIITGITGNFRLGPVLVSVDNVGVRLLLTSVGANQPAGVFGDLDLSFDFKPPDGIGIVVDVGPITGGGFLSYDDVAGRYTGALELEIYDIAVKAIGILDTRLPGGRPAYSFLILISSEFTPIPLGLGFMLEGVGGLAGIHRSVNVELLRSLLGDKRLNHILFPENPVRDAVQIVSDLQEVFPPTADRYVFGPMARISWGTAGLLTGELGILLELPEPVRLVLLGQFRAALPRPDNAIAELNLDVLGVLDLEHQLLALDGRLRDSRVASFTIEGAFALRLVGGDSPNFALAIGGFHPDYKPPTGFPELKRITIPIGLDDDVRITLTGYLALTSNTLQVGAAAEVYAEAGGFNILGKVSFDTLFTFSPFAFITDFSGKVTLRMDQTELATISLQATLSGPAPWHAWGEACLEIRWWPDICVPFDVTFGRERRVELPVVDPWPLLRESIENPDNWSGGRPNGAYRGATLASAPGTSNLLDPIGEITFRQSVVPLNRQITRFGQTRPPGGTDRFTIGKVTASKKRVDWSQAEDFFAPAQFEELSDAEKLSRPSFERMEAGFTLARAAVDHGEPVGTRVEYETIILDSAFTSRHDKLYLPDLEVQLGALERVAAQSPLQNSGRRKFTPPAVQPLVVLTGERFVVASRADLSQRADIAQPTGKGAAFQALTSYLASHPGEVGQFEVISLDELSA